MTGIPPRNLSEYRPQLRVSASPTDPYVTPGLAAPELLNWEALSQIAPSLQKAFQGMEQEAIKEANRSLETNAVKLYNLTSEQVDATLTDPKSEAVAEFMKQAGVKSWHNPRVREQALNVLGTKAVDQSSAYGLLKSIDGQEKIARARMDAGPDEKMQQEAGFKAAMSIVEKELGELIAGSDSEIAKGAMRKRITAMALEANMAAQKIEDTLHRRDVEQNIHNKMQSVFNILDKMSVENPEMLNGEIDSISKYLKQTQKDNPTIKVADLALDSIKTLGNLIAEDSTLESEEMESYAHLISRLAEDEKGVLGTKDTQLAEVQESIQNKILRRERIERDPSNSLKRREILAEEFDDYFAQLWSSGKTVTPQQIVRDIQSQTDKWEKLKKDHGVLTTDLMELAKTKAIEEETEPKHAGMLHELTLEIRGGNASNYNKLLSGTHPDKEKQALFDSLSASQYSNLSSIYAGKLEKTRRNQMAQVKTTIMDQVRPFMLSSQFRSSERHNAEISQFAKQLEAEAEQMLDDGMLPGDVQKWVVETVKERRPDGEKITREIEQAENLQNVFSSPDLRDTMNQLRNEMAETRNQLIQDAKLEMEPPDLLQNSQIEDTFINQAMLQLKSDMPKIREEAQQQMEQKGYTIDGPMLATTMSSIAAEKLRQLVRAKRKNYKNSISEKLFPLVAPTLKDAHAKLESPPAIQWQMPKDKSSKAKHDVIDRVATTYRLDRADSQEFVQQERQLTSGFQPGTYGSSVFRNARATAEFQAASAIMSAKESVRVKGHYAASKEDKNYMLSGILLYGLDAKTLASGKMSNGVSISDIYQGQDWRRMVNPRMVRLFDSSTKLAAFKKRADEGKATEDEVSAFRNIGYDIVNSAEDRDQIFQYQREILDNLEKLPKASKFIRETRQEFLR